MYPASCTFKYFIHRFTARILIVFFILIRWTIPRFRYDQLMDLGWKLMLPMAILNILVTELSERKAETTERS